MPRIGDRELRFAADQFLQMIVSMPQSRAMGLGAPMDADELRSWVRGTVALFLNGFEATARGGPRPETGGSA